MISLAVALTAGMATFYSVEVVRYFFRVLRWLPRHEQAVRTSAGLCPGCGYDLTGNVSGICPECGAKVAHEAVDDSHVPALVRDRQPWWVWATVAGMMMLAVIWQRWLRT